MSLPFLMNPPEHWRRLVTASHSGFIEPDFLFEMGEIYRREAAGEVFASTQTVPRIPLSFCGFDQAEQVVASMAGFDLPGLFLPAKGWSGRLIGLLGQDPLRHERWAPPCLSCCTPWGLSWEGNRRKGFGRFVWTLVNSVLSVGHGVYITDISKLYAPKIAKSTRLLAQEHAVFRAEVAMAEAIAWITFGQQAAAGAMEVIPRERLVSLPHPNARGSHLQRHFGTADGRHETITRLMAAEILRHLEEQRVLVENRGAPHP